MFFKLQKPDLSKINESEIAKVFSGDNGADFFDFIKRVSQTDYLYWDKVQYKEPSPAGISKESLWMLVKFIRKQNSLKTVIKNKHGEFFTWSKLDYFEEFFHNLDMNTGGELFVENDGISKANKQKLITRGIMEEAIASSQLEGAATSRQAAKKMLREGRKPTNKSEQMIVNNYISMKAIEEDYKDKQLSADLVLELHKLVTKNTLDSENEVPRMRKKEENIYVSDDVSGEIYHEAPDMDFVKSELETLIKFANNELKTDTFIHPIVKAIMIHFWIGYLHPFTDGNGRLARLLFYWYLVKEGYWAFVYLPISKAIKRSPKKYIMAYVYSEQDDNDLNYFIEYNIGKIKSALNDFSEYLKRQSESNVQMKRKSQEEHGLNMRQVYLLQYLHGDLEGRINLKTHMNVNQISKMTASKDLKDLEKKGFLISKKQGRFVYYFGTEKIGKLF